ncbi:MAG: hypothetical protein O7F12_06720 [Nitrospirae bacterium]|nr:hypothetical protein [Nitrospirota bacterium]
MRERFNLWLEETSPVQRRMGLSVLCCVVLGGMWFWNIAPTLDVVSQLEEEIKVLNEVIKKSQATLESDIRNRMNLPELERLVLSHKESIGIDGQNEDALEVFSQLVKRSGLTILLWKPSSVKFDESLQSTLKPVQAHVDGQFYQLARFFDELSRVMPNIQIMGFELRSHPQRTDPGGIQATLRFNILSPSQELLIEAT